MRNKKSKLLYFDDETKAILRDFTNVSKYVRSLITQHEFFWTKALNNLQNRFNFTKSEIMEMVSDIRILTDRKIPEEATVSIHCIFNELHLGNTKLKKILEE